MEPFVLFVFCKHQGDKQHYSSNIGVFLKKSGTFLNGEVWRWVLYPYLILILSHFPNWTSSRWFPSMDRIQNISNRDKYLLH